MFTGMIGLLLQILVLALIGWLAIWLVDQLPLIPQIKTIFRVIVIVILILYLMALLVGMPLPLWR